MARLPIISGDDFVKAVARIGFVWDRTEGSHMILVGPGAGGEGSVAKILSGIH